MMEENCRQSCTNKDIDGNDVAFVNMNVCATEEKAPLFVNAQRWRSFLLAYSSAFRNLVEEQQAGWRSAALDAWYAQRRREDAERVKQTSTKEIEKNNCINDTRGDNIKFSTDRNVYSNIVNKGINICSCGNSSTSSITSARPNSTIFTNVNMTLLSERYRSHIRQMFDSTFATRNFFCINNNEKQNNNIGMAYNEKLSSSYQVDKLQRTNTCIEYNNSVGKYEQEQQEHVLDEEERNVEHKEQTQIEKYTFLDLGCAPGGMAKYLIKDLHWSGVGLTLSPEVGGIELDSELLNPSSSSSFTLLTGSVVEPESTWKVVEVQTCTWDSHAKSCEVNNSLCQNKEKEYDKEVNELLLSNRKFYFVNGGAVQDYGQRTEMATNKTTNKNIAECKRARCEVDKQTCTTKGKMSNINQDMIVEHCTHTLTKAKDHSCSHDEKAILPWLTLLVPQLSLALEHVCPFGAFMLLHGYPSCASLFILLRVLKNIVHAHCNNDMSTCDSAKTYYATTTTFKSAEYTKARTYNIASKQLECEQHVHIFETIHLAKAPVYILWDSVNVQGKEREIDRLLNSLDSSSSVVNPLELDASEFDSKTNEETKHVTLMERKQKFWLGESDDGFALAKEGFHLYRHDLERVWQRSAEFLRTRRLRAERAMTKHKQTYYTK